MKTYLEYLLEVTAMGHPKGTIGFNKLPLNERLDTLHANVAEGLLISLNDDNYTQNGSYGPSHMFGFLTSYMKHKAKIHCIADKFGSHLDKTKLDLPTSIIPYEDGKYHFIEFPHQFHDEKTDDYHHNVIVYMGVKLELDLPGLEKPIILTLRGCDKGLVFIFPDYNKDKSPKNTQTFLRLDPTADSTIEKIIEHHITHGLNSTEHLKRLVAFTLKCLLYINSGDPDLENENHKPISTKNPKKQRRHIKNERLVDIIKVGYGMHKRHFYVDGGDVVGHYRWQPYGPGRTQVKLIWINEHTRKYGTKE